MVTKVAGPFDIRPIGMTLKPKDRILPVLGQILDISGVAANSAIQPLVGKGLSQSDGDRLAEHNTDDKAMWLGKKADLADGLVFDLGTATEIESIEIWNYNKPGYTSQGVAKADVDVLTEDGTWQTIQKGASFQEAEGSKDYDEPTILSFQPVKAQKVRFSNLAAFGDEGVVGLSDVRFHKTLGFEACNLQPQQNAELKPSGQTKLTWTPGKDSVVHDIYAGLTPDSLSLLGRTAESEATLSGLACGTKYYWRLDAVKADGTVTKGEIYTFALGEGQLWRNWNLDEIKDNKNLDPSGKHSVELVNNAKWLETDGPRAGVVELDGSSSYLKASALKKKTNVMTISLWLCADGIQSSYTGLAFCRGGNTVAGLNLRDNNELGYHWNNDSQTYDFQSNLTIPQGKWIFAAVAVEPTRATLYLYEDGKLKSAVNEVRHEEEEFDASLMFGRDPENGTNRFFKGKIDDIKIFNYCLAPQQIQALAENKSIEPVRAEYVLTLVDTKLVGSQADLNVLAKQAEAKQQEMESSPKRSFWPIVIIVGIIAAIGIFVRIGKK